MITQRPSLINHIMAAEYIAVGTLIDEFNFVLALSLISMPVDGPPQFATTVEDEEYSQRISSLAAIFV